MLSIIVPCYNEEETIKTLLQKLFNTNFPIDREIIVIDDGSKINHKDIIYEEIINKKIKFIRLSKNQGKGVAIRVGMKYANGDIFIIQDADLEYNPSDIPKLIQPILKNEVNVVYGSRFFTKPKRMSRFHYIGNRILTKLTNIIYNVKLTDMETGYKAFSRKILQKLKLTAREFEFEPEITSQIILNGYKIKELPIKYHVREFGYAKINILDGIEGALILMKYRYFNDSKFYNFLFDIYKFHFKRIVKKIIRKLNI
ncbi:MAG: glycosyltransferase family 2 protein [Candidatus Hodarchaeota archaeon]